PEQWERTAEGVAEHEAFFFQRTVGDASHNFIVTNELYVNSFQQYLLDTLESLRDFEDFELLSLEPFETQTELDARRIETKARFDGVLVQQVYYLFDGGPLKYIAICTRLDESETDPIPVCDASARTFRVHEIPHQRYREAEAGFSFLPPESWHLQTAPGLHYKFAFGPVSHDFSPNVGVIPELYDGNLDDFIAGLLENLTVTHDEFLFHDQSDIRSAEGRPGKKVVTSGKVSGEAVHQTFYIFDTGELKYSVICTRRLDAQTEIDALCEEAARSLELTN
ncbi:MAG: hypothetical protein ACNA8W_26015, partial [Bradymonadaceae bacterium]